MAEPLGTLTELSALAEKHEVKVGALFMGLRVAVTGAIASPPLLPSIDLVGTAESVARIRDLAERVPRPDPSSA